MSQIDIYAADRLLRDVEAEIRIAQDALATARSHQYQASVNSCNSKGSMIGTMALDGKTRDRNVARREMFQKPFDEVRAKTKEAENRLQELQAQKQSLKLELGLP